MPLPNPELIGLPAPAPLLQFLLGLTFSLHLVPMALTMGGTIAALYCEIMGFARPGGPHRPLARRLWGLLPTITSFTITLGVAPLLFVQLLYPKFFYPASVLTGWSWFAVVPVLLVGYGLLYLQAMGHPEARWRPWAGLGAMAAFLTIGSVYVSTMSLTTEPGLWKELYAQSQSGTHFHLVLPRALHVLTGALVMTGGLVTLLGHLSVDELFGRFARRFGLTWLVGALVLAIPVGLWYMSTLTMAVNQPMLLIMGALAALGFVAFVLAGVQQRSPLLAWLGMTGLAGAASCLASLRHLVRQALMEPYLSLASDWKLQPQWDVFVIFAVMLVAALGVVSFMLIRFLQEGRDAEARLSRSAD